MQHLIFILLGLWAVSRLATAEECEYPKGLTPQNATSIEQISKIGNCLYWQDEIKNSEAWLLAAASAEVINAQEKLGAIYHFGSGGITVDYDNAVKWYSRASANGSGYASNGLAAMYEHGLGVAENQEKKREYIKLSAQQGNSSGQYNLGALYAHEYNRNEAFKWYLKAANNGLTEAKLEIADSYLWGHGTDEDISTSFFWYLAAAHDGDIRGQDRTASMLRLGAGVSGNVEEALYWFKKAAEQGGTNAMESLAEIYLDDQVIERDEEQASYWLEKAGNSWLSIKLKLLLHEPAKNAKTSFYKIREKANNEDRQAQYDLAVLFDEGRYIPEDDFAAMKWFRNAAKLGHEPARYSLDFLEFMYGIRQPTSETAVKTVKWFKQQAEKGDVRAAYQLGRSYDRGFGFERDDSKAVKWYQISANDGYLTALHNLGLMYERGQGVATNNAEALALIRRGAEGGYTLSQNALAARYTEGNGVKANNEMAFRWHFKAAIQGNSGSQDTLGYLYDNGIGVEKNHVEAVRWMEKAARQGESNAMTNLAIMYKTGRGTQRSYANCYLWAKMSSYFNEENNKNAAVCKEHLDSDDLIRLDKQAKELYDSL